MEVDRPRQSSSDASHILPEENHLQNPSTTAEQAFVDLTIEDSQETDEEKHRAAEFLLATAAAAPLSRSPSSPLPLPSELRLNGHTKPASPVGPRPARSSFQTTPVLSSAVESPSPKKIHKARKGAASQKLPTRSAGYVIQSGSGASASRSRSRSPQPARSSSGFRFRLTEQSFDDHTPSPIGTRGLSLIAFEAELRRLLQVLRSEHMLLLQSRLTAARVQHASQGPTAIHVQNTIFSALQDTSPFADMKASDSSDETSYLKPANDIGVFSVSTAHTVKNLVAGKSVYRDKSRIIPPFSNYVSVKENILAKDDDSRTYIPYHGDDFVMNNHDDYAALEEKFEKNKVKHRRTCGLAERARIWHPFVLDFLASFDLPAEAVIAFLAGGTERSNPPRELPKDMAPAWHALRGAHSSDLKRLDKEMFQRGFRAHAAYHTLTDKQLAAACLASKAFLNIAGISIWHIVKHEISAKEVSFASSGAKSTGSRMVDAYTKLDCLVCNTHECLGHGEFDSQSGSRIRVSYATTISMDRRDNTRFGITENKLQEYRGLEEDGAVKGTEWAPLRTTDQGFEDHETCSEECFWLKKHRRPPLPHWPAQDLEILANLRPGYQDDLRGPCMLFQIGLIKRPCVEIFLMLIGTASESLQIPAHIRNENALEPLRLPARKPASYYIDNPATNKTHMHQDRQPFTPCAHAGPCEQSEHCICANQHIVCEKTCACPPTCARRFRGCRCAQRGKICRESDRCECWLLNRECDPDLCRPCGAAEVLDAANRHRADADVTHGRCANVAIQRGVPKRTLLGDSRIMASAKKKREGLGLYMGEPCRKDDFIGEYVGEIISEAETERREAVYDKRNLSYLFTLNRDQTVDSTYVGNKTRFINCETDENANTHAKVLFCNGVQRIGLFARRAIEPGEELCFNYGEAFMRKLVPSKGRLVPPPAAAAVAAPRRGRVQKVTLSKNGIRIGRPPKNPQPLPLSSAASTATTTGTARSGRKRRRSEVFAESSEEDLQAPATKHAGAAGQARRVGARASGQAAVEDEEDVDEFDDSEDASFSEEEEEEDVEELEEEEEGSEESQPDEEMADVYSEDDST